MQLESSEAKGPPNTDPIQIELLSDTVVRQLQDEPSEFSVRITNVSDRPLWMVGVVPGSEGLRYPHYVAAIEGPDGPEQPRIPEDLDYVRGLRAEDFVRLDPGQSFDPQGEGFIPIQQLAWFRPNKPGRYRFRLCFDASEPDPRQWLGHTPGADQRQIEMLIQQVPPVKIWSNTLEIEYR